MPVSVSHIFTNAIADGTNTQIVRPSDWNSAHTVSINLSADEAIKWASAGTTSMSSGTLQFSNANGVSFGLDGGTITASHNALTSQSNQAASASNGSFTFQTLGFSNANNVTFGTSAGSIVTASVAVAGAASVNFSAGTTSGNLDSVVFSNSNGISFGLNGSTVTGSHNALTTAMASNAATISNIRVSAGTTSNLLSALTFDNGNGITFGLNASTVTASHNGLTSQSNQAASASNGSFTFQTLGFSNANNVTFGTSAGSIVTASVGAVGAASVNFSAGTTSGNLDSVVFSNANGVSFGLNGSTVTGSVAAAGGGGTLQHWVPFGLATSSKNIFGNGTAQIAPFEACNHVTATILRHIISMSLSTSSNSSHAGTLSMSAGLYTLNGSTLSLATSGSAFVAWTNTSNNSTSLVAAHRYFDIPMNVSLSPGLYWVLLHSLTSTGNANWWTGSNGFYHNWGTNTLGSIGEASNTSRGVMMPGFGDFSVSFSSAIPASIAFSDIRENGFGKAPLIMFHNQTY